MIVVEERLEEMFAELPEMVSEDKISFKPIFGCGDEKELNAFLMKRKGLTSYPLIWLEYPYIEEQLKSKVELNSVSLILACETNTEMLNDERLKTNYKNVLIPLYNNIVELFNKANIVNIDDRIYVTKFPLMSSNIQEDADEVNKTIDIWDAIKMTFDCSITNNCFRGNIKFRNNEQEYRKQKNSCL